MIKLTFTHFLFILLCTYFRSPGNGVLDSVMFDAYAAVLTESGRIKFLWISCKQVHLKIVLLQYFK